MTVILELPPDIEERVAQEAAQQGMPLPDYLITVIRQRKMSLSEGLAEAGRRRGVAAFVKGDVVIVPFPYSDLSQTKRRPAVVVAVLPGEDVMLCQITSHTVSDRDTVHHG